MKNKALFLDRDGTINIDYGYVYRHEDFHFIKGVFDLVSAAKDLGYLVIIVTNQSGIGRGYYTESDFHILMDWVKSQFERQGGSIDAVYFCPDHPNYGKGAYQRDTIMRKPGPGMLLKAAQEWNIDLSQSILVGDSEADIKAGQLAGVGKICHFVSTVQMKSVDIEQVDDITKVIPLLKHCRCGT